MLSLLHCFVADQVTILSSGIALCCSFFVCVCVHCDCIVVLSSGKQRKNASIARENERLFSDFDNTLPHYSFFFFKLSSRANTYTSRSMVGI